MTIRQFISIFTATAAAACILNILWFAVLAAPVAWLWNWSVTPLGSLPALTYSRAFGLLLLWFLLRLARVKVKLSTKSKTSK